MGEKSASFRSFKGSQGLGKGVCDGGAFAVWKKERRGTSDLRAGESKGWRGTRAIQGKLKFWNQTTESKGARVL